jgi:biotin transport system substrate-specific component
MSTGAAATLVGTLLGSPASGSGPTGHGAGLRSRASAGDVASARQVDAFEATVLRASAVLFVTVLTALGAQISVPLPFTPVPFTLQPMIVLLGGAALGARLGASAQALYLLIGLAGLPVFAASPLLPQGAARLIGPTAGFLVSYPLAAFVAGWLAERRFDRQYLTSLAAMTAGLAVIFAGGLSWLAYGPTALGLSGAVATALTPFLVADIVKLCLAAAVLPTVWRFVGDRRS